MTAPKLLVVRIFHDAFSPILRPLSDMTTEEKKELNEIKEKHWNTDLEYQSAQVKWHLSKHFDLFGLIKSGKSIDKTKL